MKNVKHNLKDKGLYQRRNCGCIVKIVPSRNTPGIYEVLYFGSTEKCPKYEEHTTVIVYHPDLIEIYYQKKYL